MTKSYPQTRQIGIALSGGGVRAAAFHAGVFRWLAEQGQLEQIKHVSSVSGGSLFTGLVIHVSGYQWPTSEQYQQTVYPRIKEILTLNSLQGDALRRLILNPLNWQFMLSRANVLAQSIEKFWGIQGTLGQLPMVPIWSINGTTAENGKRFRFKNRQGGDYDIGYADFTDFSLARAMAVSAAFPGGIGPLTLDTSAYTWYKRESWDTTDSTLVRDSPFNRLHLYDGGLYDNLGIEPLFDIGQRTIKDSAGDIDFIIVSDAGTPLTPFLAPSFMGWRRLVRFMDIIMNQARALRVRSFVNFLQQNSSAGTYLQIGSDSTDRIQKYATGSNHDSQLEFTNGLWLSLEEVRHAAAIPTTLRRLSEMEFDLLARHGYETISWNSMLFNSM